MESIIPLNPVNLLFLCSGLCEKELEFIKLLYKQNYQISKITLLDMIYENNNTLTSKIAEDIKLIYPNTKIDFMYSFYQLKEVTTKYDIIISINFQVMLFIDDMNNLNKHYEKKWNLYCLMQDLHSLYYGILWLYYDSDQFNINQFTKKTGSHFNTIAEKTFNSLPSHFIEKKLTSLIQ